MLISKSVIRRLIRESIEDFAKADFVAGTEIDQTAIPRQIFDNIHNWLNNRENQEMIRKLKAFRQEIDTNPKTKFYGPDRTEMLNQYHTLTTGITSDTVAGGMKGSEIDRFQKRYIAFLGDQLVQQHPKLREYISSNRSKYFTRPGVKEEENQIDMLFQPLFELIDEIGIGPVTYFDYVRAKESIHYFDTGRPYYRTSSSSSRDPVSNINTHNLIFNQDARTGPTRYEFDAKDYSMTSKFNSQNTNITDGLGLYEIKVRYDLNSHYDMDYDYSDYDYDRFLENTIEEAYDAPGMITSPEPSTNEHGHPIVKYFIIATNAELGIFETSIKNKVISVEDIGPDNHTADIILDIDSKMHIEPNSMDAIKKFLDPHGAGIPTHSNSVQGIRREHETFLQDAKNSAQNSLNGDVNFASVAEEETSVLKHVLILDILELKGHGSLGI